MKNKSRAQISSLVFYERYQNVALIRSFEVFGRVAARRDLFILIRPCRLG